MILSDDLYGDSSVENAVAELRERGFDLAVHSAASAGEFDVLARQATDENIDVVVASGGDGTINELLHILQETDSLGRIAAGILPAGTANDFATACGIPTDDPGAALRLTAETPLVEIDVGRVNGRLFVNAASGGYGAEVTASAPPKLKQTLGGFAYLVNGLLHVPDITPRSTHVRARDFEWEGGMIGFSIGNGRLAGGGFEIAPGAKVDDGLLDLILFPEVQEGGWSGLVADVIGNTKDGDFTYLINHQSPWFEIAVEESIHFNVDGEPHEATNLHFDVLNRQTRFCLPTSDIWTE